MAEKNDEYYKMAISWGEAYLKENTEPKKLSIKAGEIITNDLYYVDVQINRIKSSTGQELHASYSRLREFKVFVEKCKQMLDKII